MFQDSQDYTERHSLKKASRREEAPSLRRLGSSFSTNLGRLRLYAFPSHSPALDPTRLTSAGRR